MNTYTWIIFFAATLAQSIAFDNKSHEKLTDGTYTGSSRSIYTDEPYIGKVTLEVKNQKIITAKFQITDTLQHEVFGPDYDKHYPDNVMYQEQCHNDWKGVQFYPSELIKKQNIDSVDAVSGATWSYNIFKASVKKALNK